MSSVAIASKLVTSCGRPSSPLRSTDALGNRAAHLAPSGLVRSSDVLGSDTSTRATAGRCGLQSHVDARQLDHHAKGLAVHAHAPSVAEISSADRFSARVEDKASSRSERPSPVSATYAGPRAESLGGLRAEETPSHLVFVYGTLKQGFSNHWLIQELMLSRDLTFVGLARTSDNYPLVCGPFKVPFLLHLPGSGMRVHGEVYAANERALARLDDLEGVDKGHYMRSVLDVEDLEPAANAAGDLLEELLRKPSRPHAQGGSSHRRKIRAEAYFAGVNHTPGLAQACAIECYDRVAASGYIPRRGRPTGKTFLEHVEHWLCEQGFRNVEEQPGQRLWPFSRWLRS